MTMDPYNKALTAPVWQRVLGGGTDGEVPWELLLSGTRRAARAYFSLSQVQKNSIGEELRRLAREKEDQFYVLSGLYRLRWNKSLKLPPAPPEPREHPIPALSRRYREETALLRALESTGGSEFHALAHRVRENQMTVLALLGRLER